jgi:hypothetical protein
MNLGLELIHPDYLFEWQYLGDGFPHLMGPPNNIPGDQTTGIFLDFHPRLSSRLRRELFVSWKNDRRCAP